MTTKQNGAVPQLNYIQVSALEFKSEKREDGRFYISGYAAIFGNIDDWDDVIEPGATLSMSDSAKKRIKFCQNHNLETTSVIGKILPETFGENAIGLAFVARMGRTTQAQNAILQIEDEEISELSISYIAHKWYIKDDVRYLTEIEIIEISLVSRAANSLATIMSIERKSQQIIVELKSMPNSELLLLEKAVREEKAERTIKQLNFKN